MRHYAGGQTGEQIQFEPYTMPTPTPDDLADGSLPEVYQPTFNAPVVHMTSGEKNILVDVPFGEGTIVYLTDPYIVSNTGIGMVDNAQLAINLLTAAGGLVAFDEYHHGYGASNNRFLEYFCNALSSSRRSFIRKAADSLDRYPTADRTGFPNSSMCPRWPICSGG